MLRCLLWNFIEENFEIFLLIAVIPRNKLDPEPVGPWDRSVEWSSILEAIGRAHWTTFNANFEEITAQNKSASTNVFCPFSLSTSPHLPTPPPFYLSFTSSPILFLSIYNSQSLFDFVRLLYWSLTYFLNIEIDDSCMLNNYDAIYIGVFMIPRFFRIIRSFCFLYKWMFNLVKHFFLNFKILIFDHKNLLGKKYIMKQ